MRLTSDRKSSWLWPGVLIFLLVALWVYGATVTADRIEQEVEEQVAANLVQSGFVVRSVAADGQSATARVEVASANSPYALAVARSAECRTWAGNLICPRDVTIDPLSVAEAVTAARRFHDFSFKRSGSLLQLEGEVSDTKERDRLVVQATQRFGEVADRLVVTGEKATTGWRNASVIALDVLRLMSSGAVSWRQGRFDVEGVAQPFSAPIIRNVMEGASTIGEIGKLTVESDSANYPANIANPGAQVSPRRSLNYYQAAPAAIEFTGYRAANEIQILAMKKANEQRCNDGFAAILSKSGIGSSRQDAQFEGRADPIWAKIAALANQCEGRLFIEAHSSAGADVEDALSSSQQRANSARDALIRFGVDSDRINAIGIGANRPLIFADSIYAERLNRRFVVRVESPVYSR